VAFCSATFFCARKNATHFSLSGAKKRHLPPERYAPVLRGEKYLRKRRIKQDKLVKIEM
jgi:hypothetical protein